MKTFKQIYTLILENILIEESIKDDAIKRFGEGSQEIVNKFWDEIRHKENDPKKKDINFWLKGSFEDFKNYVKTFKSNKQEDKESKEGAKKIFEDDTWLIITPLTKEAAIEYGKGTKWCTSALKENQFEMYNVNGRLYYIINKKDNEKYAVYYHNTLIRNAKDKTIKVKLSSIFPEYILDLLVKLAKDNNRLVEFVSLIDKVSQKKYIKQYNINNGDMLAREIIKYMINNIDLLAPDKIIQYIQDKLDNGANLTFQNNTIWEIAVDHYSYDIIDYLIKKLKLDIHLNNNYLLKAFSKEERGLTFALNNGIEINEITDTDSLLYAIKYSRSVSFIKLLIEKGMDTSILTNDFIQNVRSPEVKEYLQSIIDN